MKVSNYIHGLEIGVWLANITASDALLGESKTHIPLALRDSDFEANFIIEIGGSTPVEEKI